jgi:hypothetical protein
LAVVGPIVLMHDYFRVWPWRFCLLSVLAQRCNSHRWNACPGPWARATKTSEVPCIRNRRGNRVDSCHFRDCTSPV